MYLMDSATLGNNSRRKQYVEKWVLWVGILLIFLPKINLVSVGGQTAGLRIDDFALGLIFLYAFRKVNFSRLSVIEAAFLLTIFFWLLSNILNIVFYQRSNLLYTLRYVEYFLFYYIGFLFSRKYNIDQFLIGFVAVNGVVMIMQLSGIIGGFSSTGIVSDVTDRAIGLTGGPWEIGAILNFAFALFSMNSKAAKKKIVVFLFYLITFILILLTGSRMSLLAHLVLLIMYLYRMISNKILFVIYLSVIGALMIGVFSIFSGTVSDRSQNAFSITNLEVFSEAYRNVVIRSNFVGFSDFYADETADMSWLMRVFKWSYAIKSWVAVPFQWILGVGPGTWGTALDGGILRLLTETGIIGFVLFCNLLKKIIKIEACLLPLVFAFLINMLMIDIYISYKSMAFVLFAVGYFDQLKRLDSRLCKQPVN
jgi:hypothetical protein